MKCEDETLEGLVKNKSNDKMEQRIFKQKILIVVQSGLLAREWEEQRKERKYSFPLHLLTPTVTAVHGQPNF